MPSWCQYNRNKYTDQHCDSANTQTAREFYVNIVLCLHFARGDVKLGMLLSGFTYVHGGLTGAWGHTAQPR